MKVCIRCNLAKSLDEFGNYARYADGKHRYCRSCWNTIANTWKHANGTKPRLPFLERLWGGIQQCGHEDICLYCCWPWTKGCDQDGYGKISWKSATRPISAVVTRVVYEVWNGIPIPDGMLVCHHCDTPACANPLHLWLGSLNDNRQDCMRKGRYAKGLTAGVYTKPEAFPRGEAHPRATLTESQVLLIRAYYAAGTWNSIELAQTFNVSKYAILCVIHRKTWKHI